jgi:hypothetical protein
MATTTPNILWGNMQALLFESWGIPRIIDAGTLNRNYPSTAEQLDGLHVAIP